MTKIKLADKTIELIKSVCAQFNNEESELINVLHQVQSKLGYLPAEVQEVIAKELDMSVAKVYGRRSNLLLFLHDVTSGTISHFNLHGNSLLCAWWREGFTGI